MENQSHQRRFQDQPFSDEMFQEKEIHLSEYIEILTKRKGLIFLFFILTLSVTILFTLKTTPIYESTSQLIIDKERNTSPITGERMEFEGYASETLTFQTHFKLIKSTPVIQNVVSALRLDQMKEEELEISPIRNLIRQLKENIELLFSSTDDTTIKMEIPLIDPATEKMNRLIEDVREKIDIQEVRNTRLLDISVKDKDPAMAAHIANTLAKEYIRFNLSNRVESSKDNLDWLNNELYGLKKKLEDDERTFFEYKQQSKLFSMEGKQKVVDQKISEFNTKYLEARNQRMELDSKIAELQKHLVSSRGLAKVRSLLNNTFIENLYNQINNLEIEYSKLSKVYKSKHPKLVQLQSQLAKSRTRMKEELAKELANLKSQRTVLKAREDVLERTIGEFEQDALDTSGKELKYTILQRNVNTSQNLYDIMVTRVKESDILKTSDTSNIRIVESAAISPIPVSPNKKRNFLLGIVLGLMGGVGLAFFFEYLDQTLRTEEDIQAYLNLPVLSVVPEADKSSGYGYTHGGKS
ncbi:MAG: GumC family protein [Desulfobacterium sp.]